LLQRNRSHFVKGLKWHRRAARAPGLAIEPPGQAAEARAECRRAASPRRKATTPTAMKAGVIRSGGRKSGVSGDGIPPAKTGAWALVHFVDGSGGSQRPGRAFEGPAYGAGAPAGRELAREAGDRAPGTLDNTPMQSFASLLDRLVLTPQRNVKLRLLVDYFRTTPDPDRGYALAALTGDLAIPSVKPAMLRALMAERLDEVLFAYSYDYVGDLAETISLVWRPAGRRDAATTDLLAMTGADPLPPSQDDPLPASPLPAEGMPAPRLSDVVERLQRASRSEGPRLVEGWLDRLDASGRYALIKLVAGGLRIGVSARLAKQALAAMGGKEINEVEEAWPGLAPPYVTLFAWLEGRGERPVSNVRAPFRPVMLSHALADSELAAIRPEDYAAEWKWDGIRVQAVREAGVARLYTRTGDDISQTFPDLVDALDFEGAVDGELLIGSEEGGVLRLGSFSDLQQRLNRKTVSAKLMESHPAVIRAYDCLVDGSEDLRTQPFRARRARLEALVCRSASRRLDLSPLVPFADGAALEALRTAPPEPIIEGLMLKRWDSAYEPGRPKGPWFKWKRDPHVVDAVLMYAQRGHGKRSSYYSDYTFGVWTEGEAGEELVPVGKAYFGFTDAELVEIDRFVRNNTVNRFGPVREVVHEAGKGLVLEVAFEGLQRSARHRSGIAMRFPRVSRLRWDKPPSEADRLETLTRLLPA
jgi:DNA ligase-1